MNESSWRLGIMLAAALLVMTGCGRKENSAAAPTGAASPSDSAAVVAAMTRGMRPVPPASLSGSHIGKTCVAMAHSPEGGTRIAPPPPPMGMVYIMGSTTVYKGQLHALSADAVEIRASYPTSTNVKIVSIPRAQIQSVHLAP